MEPNGSVPQNRILQQLTQDALIIRERLVAICAQLPRSAELDELVLAIATIDDILRNAVERHVRDLIGIDRRAREMASWPDTDHARTRIH